jgi:predicted site-specific integrase-resolvase
MNQSILTSRDVMAMLDICENTLLKLERNGKIKVDFRISNRKRYLKENILNSLKRL